MTKCFVILYSMLLVHAAVAQPSAAIRYKDFVFEEAIITKNVLYLAQIPEAAKKKAYKFDFYQPQNDTSKLRPLIIWLHGGGFKLGSKNSRGIPQWSKTFAQRGY